MKAKPGPARPAPEAAIALPQASPRASKVQAGVLELVEAYAFREAAAVLNRYLREIETREVRHIETVFARWRDLPADARPDFLTYAHHRRQPELESSP